MSQEHPGPIRLDADEMRVARPRRGRFLPVLAGVAVGLAGMAGWVWWSQQQAPPIAATARAPAPDAPPTAAPADPEIAAHYPDPGTEGLPPLAAREVPEALARFLGRGGGASWVQTDDFVQRFTATVDNLARGHAPPLKWPVNPAPGRFTVQDAPDGGQVIAAANAQRYAPFVAYVTSVDTTAAAQLYARMYPLLQQSYRQLGFPDRSFHDRLVTVIDRLLATPEPSQPIRVRLTEVKGPVASTNPWVRYEFANPEYERLTSGQKILLRMGPENERKLKAKLREIRAELVKPR